MRCQAPDVRWLGGREVLFLVAQYIRIYIPIIMISVWD